MTAEAFLSSGEAQVLFGSGFHIHPVWVQTQGGGDIIPHRKDVGLQLGGCEVEDIDILITDNGISEEAKQRIEKLGVKLIIVEI